MHFTHWKALGDAQHRAPVGALCRWIMEDQIAGLIEFEAVANSSGLPAGSDGGMQLPRAYRVCTAVEPKTAKANLEFIRKALTQISKAQLHEPVRFTAFEALECVKNLDAYLRQEAVR